MELIVLFEAEDDEPPGMVVEVVVLLDVLLVEPELVVELVLVEPVLVVVLFDWVDPVT